MRIYRRSWAGSSVAISNAPFYANVSEPRQQKEAPDELIVVRSPLAEISVQRWRPDRSQGAVSAVAI
ncbi:hypothetical protein V1289_001069 [Bradyrhizobium sp. AZCC 2289]